MDWQCRPDPMEASTLERRFGGRLALYKERRHSVLPAAHIPRRTAKAATPRRTRLRKLRLDSFAWWWRSGECFGLSERRKARS